MRKNKFQTNVRFQLKHFALLLLLSISMFQVSAAKTATQIVSASQAATHLNSDKTQNNTQFADSNKLLTRNADSAPPPMRTQKGISYQ